MRQSDIDKLISSGYSMEEIFVAINELSKISISHENMVKNNINRDDRSVVITTRDGESRKTSSIMMGYNKDGITLENGDYVSFQEFSNALEKELNKDGENVIYVSKKKNKRIEKATLVEELLRNVVKQNSNLRLEPTSVIKNQNASYVTIEDNKMNKEFRKGILMLGNKKVLLPNGEYVMAQGIYDALKDYMKMIPNIKEENNLTPPKKEEVYRVIKRIKKKMSMIPIIIALISTILSGFKMENKYNEINTSSIVTDANYSVDSLVEKSEEEIVREVKEKVSSLKIGDKLNVEAGLDYHASSDYKYGGLDTKGVFGIDNPEGEYNIDYISVVYNKQIVQVKYNKGDDLNTVLQDVAKSLNTSVNDLESYIHLGAPTSGWVDVSDIIKNETSNMKKNRKVLLDTKENIKGVNYNFNGQSITINDNGEDVRLRVVDDDGNLLKKGSIVVGSNNNEYKLQSIRLEDKNVLSTEKEYAGKTLTWSVHNFNKELLLASTATMVMVTILSKKKEEENITMSEDEIDKLVREARERFESESSFKKAVEEVSKKRVNTNVNLESILKESLIDREISVEDINNMGELLDDRE